MEILRKKPIAITAAILAAFLWGSAYPLLKLTYQVFAIESADVSTKLLLAGMRFFCAGLFVLFIRKLFRIETVPRTKQDWETVVLLGLLGVTIQYACFYVGIGNTTAVKSSIIQSSSIFMILVISTLILRIERLRAVHIVSLILGFGGVLIANTGSGFNLDFTWSGEGLLLGSSLTTAITTLIVKQRGSGGDPFFMAAGQMLIGSVPLLLYGMFTTDGLQLTSYGVSLVAYGAFLSGAAFVLWYSVIKFHSVVEMSFYRLFIPVSGALLSIIILDEPLTVQILLSLVLVIAGAFLYQLWQHYKFKR